jgi:tRNA modification GTPase
LTYSGDTIAALATPFGYGSIGIIRLSGPLVGEITRRIFRSSHNIEHFHSHKLYHGDIVSPDTGALIDEVLLCFMEKPHSYTGEDTVEINCHGGPLIIKSILNAVTSLGTRLAEPGEFTKRAFLNNRLDLSQAEAILDVIQAKTAKGLSQAVNRLQGSLEQEVWKIRDGLLDALATLEASIDFSDEDVEVEQVTLIAARLDLCLSDLSCLIATYRNGRIYQDGLRVLILGKPNVGKSSLLNALLGTDRAIVTPIPGTTRDFIEESVQVGGIPVSLMDTAGIRESADLIEEQGIALVWQKLTAADLVLMVFDGSRELDADDLLVLEKTKDKEQVIAILNKEDLPQRLNGDDLVKGRPLLKPLAISAKFKTGLSALKEEMARLAATSEVFDSDTVYITNIRHFQALSQAAEFAMKGRDNLLGGLPPEIVSVDLREALDRLEEIAGRTLPEEVLNRIFSTFCIGK